MFRKLGFYGTTLVGRVASTSQIKSGQYGLYGSVQIVIERIDNIKNPNYGQPGQQEFTRQKKTEFYFVGIKRIGKVIKNGLTVGDLLVVSYEVEQYKPDNEPYPRTQLYAKELLLHVRKQEIECLQANGLIPRQANNQQAPGYSAPQQPSQHQHPSQPKQTPPHHTGGWGRQPA